MADFTELLKADDLKNGQMKAYTAGGNEVLVARVDDKFFAANNRCPHFGGNLAGGKLESTIVTCPKHGSQFDLKDGHVVRWTEWSGSEAWHRQSVQAPKAARHVSDKG